MEKLNILFSVLFTICFIILIAGLIKPTIAVRWGKYRTRKHVLLYYGLTAIVLSVLMSETTTIPCKSTSQATVSANTKTVDHKSKQKPIVRSPIVPQSYTFQMPSTFQKGSAEYTLAEFVLSWKNQDWNSMQKYSQLTWVKNQKDPQSMLDDWFGLKILKGFKVISLTRASDVTEDVVFNVQYEFGTNNIMNEQIKARIIKESSAYHPDQQGIWGVNPSSVLSETPIK